MNQIPEIRCLEARSLLSAYLDGELSPVDDLRIEVHLETCESCRHEHRGLARVTALFRDQGSDIGTAPPWRALERRLQARESAHVSKQLEPASQLASVRQKPWLASVPAKRWIAVGTIAASFALGVGLAPFFSSGGPPSIDPATASFLEGWSPDAGVMLPVGAGIPELDAYLEEHRAREVPLDELARYVDFEPRMPRRLPGGYEIARSFVVHEQDQTNTCLLYKRGDESIALLERDTDLPALLRDVRFEERSVGGFSCLVSGRGQTSVFEIEPTEDRTGLKLTIVLQEGGADIEELVRFLGGGEAF